MLRHSVFSPWLKDTHWSPLRLDHGFLNDLRRLHLDDGIHDRNFRVAMGFCVEHDYQRRISRLFRAFHEVMVDD